MLRHTVRVSKIIAIGSILVGVVWAPGRALGQDEGDDEGPSENTSALCRDQEDNDDDGHIDCDDQDCWEFVFCSSTAERMGEAEDGAEEGDDTAEEGSTTDESGANDVISEERGRGAMITGVVLASLGTLCLATGGLMALAWDEDEAWYTASIALFGVGGAQLLAGVILSAVGGSMMRRTREESEPLVAGRGRRAAFLAPLLAPSLGGGVVVGLSAVLM